jgi:hypothetical protein
MRTRVQDYLDFGARNVWVVDPKTTDGILTTNDPDIRLDLSSLE